MNKLESNISFFDKEGFKKITGTAPVGGYYYFKVVGNFLFTFKHISNDKGVMSKDKCTFDLYVYINCNIAGYKMDRMPISIKGNTITDIEDEYLKAKGFLNLVQKSNLLDLKGKPIK